MPRNSRLPERLRSGFTLMEVIIAASILSFFMIGLFGVFRGGQQVGAQGLWLQKTVTELRNATRHISTTISRSSYPSTIVFPGTIVENDKDDFKAHYSSEPCIEASRAKAVAAKTTPGTQFLRVTESIPEQSGGALTNNAILYYHVYSLARDGRLIYNRYQRNIPQTVAPNYIKDISQAAVPSGDTTLVESVELVTDVASIGVSISATTASITPILIDIECAWPRGKTRRSERAVALPNVPTFQHNATTDADWRLN
ncbi:MAG TPA: prepilin-type N-terminal cleavage/methylation domain-containing protein [Candidatus Ozemobacteraceae bacterium]|nr:prepilin-type N-terminal cleavage/methylation domain-containing protein [Candidatus Ozemobacteraceae bacterium]HQG26982.1 prepilin-type N-terminal cleavage/methylation domain-containing protein [Candidatus Ozemobacteraceae bacterium]